MDSTFVLHAVIFVITLVGGILTVGALFSMGSPGKK